MSSRLAIVSNRFAGQRSKDNDTPHFHPFSNMYYLGHSVLSSFVKGRKSTLDWLGHLVLA